MKLATTLSAAVLAALVVLPQNAEPQISNGNDVMSKALTVHKFNTFISLARDADLTMQLTDRGPFTIFMPTDEAFAPYKDRVERIRWNKDSLRKFVLHHVVRGRIEAVEAVKMSSLTPMAGPNLKTVVMDGRGHIDGAKFAIPNVNASNGIIHGMDKVLWLP